MAWMTVGNVDKKIAQVAGIGISRYPKKNIQPEIFTLGNSTVSDKSGSDPQAAVGAYVQQTSFPIKALKIPSRVKGNLYQGSMDQLSVLIVGGVLGNELIGTEAALFFAETFLTSVHAYTALDASEGTKYSPAKDVTLYKYSLSHTNLEAILDSLTIWVVPLVNPGGRDVLLDAKGNVNGGVPQLQLGRPNPAGVCLNRNFDIAWHFRQLFNRIAYQTASDFINADDPRKASPASAEADYQGPSPNSESETKALVTLLSTNPGGTPPDGDPSITWVFDIHGQGEPASKISYPWSFDVIQTGDPTMCIRNPKYNPPATPSRCGYKFDHNSVYPQFVPPPAGSPRGTKPVKTATNTRYGEYLPAGTKGQLEELAAAFTAGAEQCLGNTWDAPSQGAVRYGCVGSLDDYALWLDRNHVRAFTIECAELQPDDQTRNVEIHEVAAGLFQAIDRICGWVKAATPNPQEALSRLSTNQLTCP